MKNYCIALALGALCTAQAETYRGISGPVIIESNLLKAIDGKTFGIHGKTMRAQLTIRTRILHMQYGTPQKDGSRLGLYLFDDHHYTVEQLQKIENEQPEARQKLQGWLKEVKADFTTKIRPFLELGRGFKPQMLIFIEESLRMHRRQDSILHMWAEEAEGEDMIAFERQVQSFDDLSHFLHDLLNFLDDLISSCPKARGLFLKSLKTDRERNLYAQRFQQMFEKQKQKINNYHRA